MTETNLKSGQINPQTYHIDKYKHLIDKSCPDKFHGKVHIHVNQDYLMWCTLNQTDIDKNSNKYYILQLLKHDIMNSYFLISRSGRVGYDNQTTLKCIVNDESKAVDEFKSIYYDKTGYLWETRFDLNQSKKDNKYMNMEMEIDKHINDSQTSSLLPVIANQIHMDTRVETFINMIFDLKMFQATMEKFQIDTSKAPLGKISQNQITKAYAILSQIQDLIQTENNADDSQKLKNNKIYISLSSAFYTLIPTSNGNQKLPLLTTDEQIKTKSELLEILGDMEIAGNIMAKISTGSPKIWQQYESLHAEIRPLQDLQMENLIRKYMIQTQGHTHKGGHRLRQVYEIHRQGEKERFDPISIVGNRQLLWHGSRMSNLVGIISQGLRIAPTGAVLTGSMFGSGVYFSNSYSKSANYMHSENGKGIMLLCEVALGETYQRKQSEYIKTLPKGKSSTWGLGQNTTDVKETVVLDDGLIIPLGKLVPSQRTGLSLLYDEFIVYDTKQVRIRYALIVDTN